MAVVAVQSLGNGMSTSFWLVYLVSQPHYLPFEVAVLVWLIAFAGAAIAVPLYARSEPRRATSSMILGLAAMVGAHLSFAFLPPVYAIVAGGLGFGTYIPTFWLPLNLLVSRETSRGNRAGRMAGVTATFTIVSVVAPAIGGFVAQAFGYPVLFLSSAGTVTANLLLVRFLKQKDETYVYRLDFRRTGRRASAAFGGQGAVDGLTIAAIPLASFLFTTAALELGILFALFSLAAGVTTYVLGLLSDRVRRRRPFLVLGPILSVPAAVAAFLMVERDLGAFALAVGIFSMTSSFAPSFILTVVLDRMEDALPQLVATRELLINVSRTLALLGALVVLALGFGVAVLFLLVGAVVLLEVLAA
jgi:MFS family permease